MNILNATSKDVTKIGTIGDALAAGWSKAPVYYSFILQIQLPMTQAQFDALFVKSVRLFLSQTQQGCTGILTNIDDAGSGFSESFLLLGLGIYAVCEDRGFSQEGAVASEAVLAAVTGSTTPSTFPMIPCGGLTAGLISQGFVPARLNYGNSTWRFINKLFQLKEFVLRAGRCEVVRERLTEIGMVQSSLGRFDGASSSLIATMNQIKETNDVMEGNDIDFRFVPPNTCADSFGTGVVSPAPNAFVTYGHPDLTSMANRIYCLPVPLMIVPGFRIDMELQTIENDCCLLPAARQAAMLTREVPYEGAPTGVVNGLSAEAYTLPGGCCSIGVLLKGYVCYPQAVIDYLTHYMACEGTYSQQLYRDNPFISGLIQKFGLQNHDNLKGLLGNSSGVQGSRPEL